MTWKERERAFYVAVMFLVVIPKVSHARLIALVLLPMLGLASSFGLWKLAISAVQRPFGILNALSFGALLVLLIVASYTGLFLALVTARF